MQWHDLLGAVLIDYFAGSAFEVDTEVDLSLKKQFLDIVVIRHRSGVFDRPLPDGFGPLVNHNLISFKSHQDTYDAWALHELIGYYVSYRKQVSAKSKKLLPANEFRLIAIASRFPDGLAKELTLVERQAGVYDIEWGRLAIRLIVIRELPAEDVNTILLLFSQAANQLEFAVRHFRKRQDDASGIIEQMIHFYKKEDQKMAVTLADLNRIAKQRMLDEMSMEERLRNVPTEERLKGVPTEERLKGVPAEERLKNVPNRDLAKEMLRNVLQREPTRAEVDELLRSLKKKSASR